MTNLNGEERKEQNPIESTLDGQETIETLTTDEQTASTSTNPDSMQHDTENAGKTYEGQNPNQNSWQVNDYWQGSYHQPVPPSGPQGAAIHPLNAQQLGAFPGASSEASRVYPASGQGMAPQGGTVWPVPPYQAWQPQSQAPYPWHPGMNNSPGMNNPPGMNHHSGMNHQPGMNQHPGINAPPPYGQHAAGFHGEAPAGKRPGNDVPQPESEQMEALKTAHFYNERYRKSGKGRMKGMLAPLLIVGLLSSVLGSAITGTWFHFYGIGAQSNGANTIQTSGSGYTDTALRQIEIIGTTDSPITAVAEKAGPSVVGIHVEYTYNDSFFGSQTGAGQGSGIIISSDGYILTNNHVVEAAAEPGATRRRFSNAGKITVILPNQLDKKYEATVIGLDAKTDIAIIKIDAQNLAVAEIGDSDVLRVGELAIAIGNPAGLEYMGSVTSGIISGLNRTVDTGGGKMLRLIQTDAAISPGNSGGALLNANGQVIGVNSSKIGGTSYEGLGFAIPINDAMQIAGSLIQDGFVTRPQIGVSIDSTFNSLAAQANSVPEGALVADVLAGSSADVAGVLTGDIITSFEGVKINGFDELEVQKNLFKPGDIVTIEVFRIPEGEGVEQGAYVDLELKLGSTAETAQ